MTTNFPRRILLGVTGGIGAYKSAELIRRLRDEFGAEVRVVMTESAKAFITPLTLHALSGFPVHENLWENAEASMAHIDLAKWADCLLIAPATANYMAKLANGLADDLLTTLCLATTAPVFLAPAMNQAMWQHPATQNNQKVLQKNGVIFLGPEYGIQACGDIGPGRLVEPENMVALLKSHFCPQGETCKQSILKDVSVLITAGPTQEALDPVRFISNYSSGKMGYALAEAAQEMGANVTLISGPVSLGVPKGVSCIQVRSAEEMYQAVMQSISHASLFISTAAVADYRPSNVAPEKIKKEAGQEKYVLELVKNPDILKEVGLLPNKPYLIGFAAETEHLVKNAMQKLEKKKLDMIIANQVGQSQGFNQDNNAGWILTSDEKIELPLMSKKAMAERILRVWKAHQAKQPRNT